MIMDILIIVAAVLISLAIGIFAGITIRKKVAESDHRKSEKGKEHSGDRRGS